MLDIYVDADACPVKDEIYRVAERYGLTVYVVSGQGVRTPRNERIHRVMVGDKFDAADDWIAERIGSGDIAVTADIPLASRCLKNGAVVIGSDGRAFTEQSIGNALAMRDLMSTLREMGQVSGGPSAMTQKDRSRFLSAIDAAVQSIRRKLPS